ncbi:hypothetical protein RNZ50_14210 [Paracoccaceae bacterium Fryx2]|nr:hypothetical protein [Paracoccaceae bacterium Fryx2]
MDDNILDEIRALRTDIAALRADMAVLRRESAEQGQMTDGLSVILTLLAGHMQRITDRLEG